MLILNIFTDFLNHPIMNIFMLVDSVIYNFIGKIYQVFITIANAEIFTSDIFKSLADRIYIVVGVVMLFVVAYSLLQAIINPDNITKGDVSIPKVIQNVVFSVVMIAVVPTLFQLMYQAQALILKQDILGSVILGGVVDMADDRSETFNAIDQKGNSIPMNVNYSDKETVIKSAGNMMSSTIFRAFFVPTVESSDPNVDPSTLVKANVSDYFRVVKGLPQTIFACMSGTRSGVVDVSFIPLVGGVVSCASNTVISTAWEIIDTVTFGLLDSKYEWTLAQADLFAQASGDIGIYAMFFDKVGTKEIDYSFILSMIAGIFVCWTLISYCIDLGVRAVKLGFYQLIAPIPIMSRILPKQKKIFDNWVKAVLMTFVEVFIRVAVIYFVIFLIVNIPNIFSNFWSNSILGTPSWGVRNLARVFIILGLLAFAKQAPKLITDIIGVDSKSMNLGIGIRSKLADTGALRVASAIGGGFTTGVRNFGRAWKENSEKTIVPRLFHTTRSTIAGAGSGAVRGFQAGKDAKDFRSTRQAASSAAQAAYQAGVDRQQYKDEHDGTFRGAMAGHAQDAWSSVRNWAAGTSGNILKLVGDEEKAIKLSKEKDSLYESPTYTAVKDAISKNQGEMAKYDPSSISQGILDATTAYNALNDTEKAGTKGAELMQKIEDLKKSQAEYAKLVDAAAQLEKRKKSIEEEGIRKNEQAAAYIAYNFQKQLSVSPELVNKLSDATRVQIDALKNVEMRGDKLVDKTTGQMINGDAAVNLIAAMDSVAKEIKSLNKEDKNSVAFQEAQRKQEQNKDKK